MKFDDQDKSPDLDPDAAWAKAARKAAFCAWVKGGKGGRLFPKADREAWAKATPGEQLRHALEFTEAVARGTAAAKATGVKGRITLWKAAGRLRAEHRAITDALALVESPWWLDAVGRARCRDILAGAIHAWGLLHFQIGQHTGMVDKRAKKPAKSVHAWENQRKGAEAKNAWKATALKRAQLICKGRTKFISQEGLADQIRGQWQPKPGKKRRPYLKSRPPRTPGLRQAKNLPKVQAKAEREAAARKPEAVAP
jgi:hypothetical protein